MVQRYAQRWHREELREVQKEGDEAITETETCTERWRGGYRDMRRDGTERAARSTERGR
jgi:hypothetical protein